MKICNECETVSAKKYVRGYCIICYNRLLKNRTLNKVNKNIPNIMTQYQSQIMSGLMLGDGHLERRLASHNTKLKVERSIKDKNFLKDNYEAFINFCASGIKYRKKDGILKFVNFSTRNVPVFNKFHDKWYIKNRKIIPEDLKLSPLTCAIWFCDDGFFYFNRKKIAMRLCTHSFSKKEVQRLAKMLSDKLGDHFNAVLFCKDGNKYYIINAYDSAARKFYKYISKYLPISMERKIARFRF